MNFPSEITIKSAFGEDLGNIKKMTSRKPKNPAIPLSEAWEKFPPSSKRKNIESDRSAWATAPSELPQLAKVRDIQETMRPIFTELATLNQAFIEHHRKQAWLREAIFDGRFVAKGIRTSPVIETQPIVIERELFSPSVKINWQKSIVRNAGQSFENVFVRKFQVAEHLDMSALAKKATEKRRPGRPSKENEILEIINELETEEIDFSRIPRIKAFFLIIQKSKLKFKLDEIKGYSDPVLQRILFRQFGIRN